MNMKEKNEDCRREEARGREGGEKEKRTPHVEGLQ